MAKRDLEGERNAMILFHFKNLQSTFRCSNKGRDSILLVEFHPRRELG